MLKISGKLFSIKAEIIILRSTKIDYQNEIPVFFFLSGQAFTCLDNLLILELLFAIIKRQ